MEINVLQRATNREPVQYKTQKVVNSWQNKGRNDNIYNNLNNQNQRYNHNNYNQNRFNQNNQNLNRQHNSNNNRYNNNNFNQNDTLKRSRPSNVNKHKKFILFYYRIMNIMRHQEKCLNQNK